VEVFKITTIMELSETQNGLSSSTEDLKPGKVEVINQLLMGIHTAVAAEAMGLASTIGLDTGQVYDIIVTAAGNSRMFEDRVPRMANIDSFPKSTLNASLQWIVSHPVLIQSSKKKPLY
jgi:hypothetical protein